MGGRRSSSLDRHSDRNDWIKEVSDSRLRAYKNTMATAHSKRRLDGSARTESTRLFFRDLIEKEIDRRSRK